MYRVSITQAQIAALVDVRTDAIRPNIIRARPTDSRVLASFVQSSSNAQRHLKGKQEVALRSRFSALDSLKKSRSSSR